MSILEILEAHQSSVLGFKCTCGVDSPRTGEAESRPFLGHRQHLAQVLEQHEREAKAEAFKHGFDHAHNQHTAHQARRNQPYPPISYTNPYRSRS